MYHKGNIIMLRNFRIFHSWLVMTVDEERRGYIKENYKAYLEGRGRLEWFLGILGESPSAEDKEAVELLERELGVMTQSQIEKSKNLRARLRTR